MCLKSQNPVFYIINFILLLILVGVDSHPNELPPKMEMLQFKGRGDYYYTTVSTPNYPAQFVTPSKGYKKFYAVNTSSLQGFENKSATVNIFLTELFVGDRVIAFYDGHGIGRPLTWETKRLAFFASPPNANGTTIPAEIQIYIPDLTGDFYLRTKANFHEIFGFNISVEVVHNPAKVNTEAVDDRGCSIRNCSFAGRCQSIPGEYGLTFKCICEEGYHGAYCQFGPGCDPINNTTFCTNGGTCRLLGSFGRMCECPPDTLGTKCQIKLKQINFVDENQECISSGSKVPNNRPCSLCNTFKLKEDWHRYIVLVKGPSNSEAEEMFKKIFEGSFVSKRLEVASGEGSYIEVYGKLSPNATISNKLSIHAVDSVFLTPYQRLEPFIRMERGNNKPLLQGETSEFSLSCTSRLSNKKHLIQIQWYKDHVPIRKEYIASRRSIRQFEYVDGNEINSVLMIDNVSPFDMGTFSCEVTDLMNNVQECADYYMTVVVPPQLEIMPMSVTLLKNEGMVVMCSDALEALHSGSHKDLKITWFKDQEVVQNTKELSTESIHPQGQLLRIRKATKSSTFVCVGSNLGGKREQGVRVEVLDSWENPYESCSKTCELVENLGVRLTWNMTKIGQTAMIKCPDGFSGYAQKRCIIGPNQQGKWDTTDFSRCTHVLLGQFNFTFQSMQNGYSVGEEGLAVLPKQLNAYLMKRSLGVDGTKQLLHGEGDKFIEMLTETFQYLCKLHQTSFLPKIIKNGHITGLLTVADAFIGFRNSCAYEISVDNLVKHFLEFIREFNIKSYNSSRIFISQTMLPLANSTNNSMPSLLTIKGANSRLIFNCNSISQEKEVREGSGRRLTLTFAEFSGILQLHNNDSFVSNEIVNVNISSSQPDYCPKKDNHFEIQFRINDTSKRNKTCAGFYPGKGWERNVCTLNISAFTISCFCQKVGTFALLAFDEEENVQPTASELIEMPADWIAISGCIVCIVICTKLLVSSLLQKTFEPYFLITSGGMITSVLCLLSIVFEGDSSREVGILYLLLTLSLQCARLWRMIWVCDDEVNEMHPWLEKRVSKYIFLAAIIFTQTLPLFTVFVFDSIFTDNKSILVQDSLVFITFALLFAISVLAIFFVYYKAYLRIHKKTTTNNNNYGDQTALNETFCSTILHMIQVLSVVLFINMREYKILHYFLSISTAALGVAWRLPKKPNSGKRRSNLTDDQIATNGSRIPASIHPLNVNEMRLLTGRSQTLTDQGRCSEDDEENDHTNATVGTSLNSASTISQHIDINNTRLKCHLSLDENQKPHGSK